jgi:hypothetical protein
MSDASTEDLDALFETCWFCKTRPAEDKAVAFAHLFKREYDKRTGQYQTEPMTCEVPRCTPCEDAHLRLDRLSVKLKPALLWFSGAVTVGAIALYNINRLGDGTVRGEILACTILLIVLGVIAAAAAKYPQWIADKFFMHGTRPEAYKNEFPTVLQEVAEGWLIGEEPS